MRFKWNWHIIVLFLFSFLIRLFFMNNGLWHHDSVHLAIAVEDFINGNFHGISGGKQGLVLVYGVFYSLFSIIGLTSEFFVTILTIIFFSLSVVVFFKFLKYFIENFEVRFMICLLYSVSGILLVSTTYASSHGLDLLVNLLVFYCLFKGISENNWKYFVISSILLGFSMFVRPSNILLIVPFLLLLIFKKYLINNLKTVGTRRDILYYFLPYFLILLLFFVVNGADFFNLASYNTFLGLSNMIYLGFLDLILSFSIVGVVLVVFGFICLIIKGERIVYWFLIWFLILFMYHVNVLSYTSRFIASSLIPLFIILSYGLLLINKFNKYFSYFLVTLIIVLMVVPIYPVLKYRSSFSGVKDHAIYVRDITPNDSVIIVYGDDSVFYSYYVNRSTIACNYESNSALEKVLNEILGMVKSGKNVYMSGTCIHNRDGGYIKKFQDSIFSIFDEIYVGEADYEDYHKNELRSNVGRYGLFKLELED